MPRTLPPIPRAESSPRCDARLWCCPRVFWRASGLVSFAFVLGIVMSPLVHIRPGPIGGSARVTHIEAVRHAAARSFRVEARKA